MCQLKCSRRRQHAGILALNEPQVLDIGEEEGFVLLDAPAQAAAELVLAELRACDARTVRKEVISIQFVIAEVFVRSAMERVGAGLCNQIDHRPAGSSLFSREGIGVDLYF